MAVDTDFCFHTINISRIVVVNLTSLTITRNIGSGPGAFPNQFNACTYLCVVGTSIYVLDRLNYRIQQWAINGTNPTTRIGTIGFSYAIFVDQYENLYDSLLNDNKVISYPPNSTISSIVAGNGNASSQPSRLNFPNGIYVNNDLTVYVADYNNHRIQIWSARASSRKTVTEDGTYGSDLSRLNNASAPNSTTDVCIISCTGNYGTSTRQLNYPVDLQFDSYGSLYVCDNGNHRIQKFAILHNPIETITTSQVPSTDCSDPIISRWPYNPSISMPRQIRRSEDFSISSSLDLYCKQSLAVFEQWTIHKCLDSSCSLKQSMTISSVHLTLVELFIPSKTPDYRVYQLTLTAYQQSLIVNPEKFSIDPDQSHFNSTNWNYTYFYGIYNQVLSPIDMSPNNGSLWSYGLNSSRSSLVISPGFLSSNQTYHFQVQLTSIYNSSVISTGNLLVQVQDDISMVIIIKEAHYTSPYAHTLSDEFAHLLYGGNQNGVCQVLTSISQVLTATTNQPNYLSMLQFDARPSQFLDTLKYVRKDLFYFGWIFLIIYISFMSLFYLLFHSKIWTCSELYRTNEILLLLKFDSEDLYQANVVLGPLVFALFIYFAVFICGTMMIAIINNGFRQIRSVDQTMATSDENLFVFLLEHAKHKLGFRGKNGMRPQDETSVEHDSPVDELLSEIDELDRILKKVCIRIR
ncbi:unnamed protein product [Adineta ricciae]|uniref:Polycystin cation channel PKD1/PKD2 domain-containing protein n=1 Tax=Adineta ricciae TaxID=249248 RepID=A0A814QZR2_ADIRI|nr:unnamed protein product [Adineta ricciae]